MKTNPYLIDFYNNYDEDSRLVLKSGSVEFLTTMRYIEKYINLSAVCWKSVRERDGIPMHWHAGDTLLMRWNWWSITLRYSEKIPYQLKI